jgi:ribosomal protein S27E
MQGSERPRPAAAPLPPVMAVLASPVEPAAAPAAKPAGHVRVECPGCGHHYRVVAEHAGKRFRCSHCQKILAVPGSTKP